MNTTQVQTEDGVDHWVAVVAVDVSGNMLFEPTTVGPVRSAPTTSGDGGTDGGGDDGDDRQEEERTTSTYILGLVVLLLLVVVVVLVLRNRRVRPPPGPEQTGSEEGLPGPSSPR